MHSFGHILQRSLLWNHRIVRDAASQRLRRSGWGRLHQAIAIEGPHDHTFTIAYILQAMLFQKIFSIQAWAKSYSTIRHNQRRGLWRICSTKLWQYLWFKDLLRGPGESGGCGTQRGPGIPKKTELGSCHPSYAPNSLENTSKTMANNAGKHHPWRIFQPPISPQKSVLGDSTWNHRHRLLFTTTDVYLGSPSGQR